MRELKFRVWDKVANQMSPEFVLFGEFTLLGAVHDWQWEISPQKKAGDENVLRYDSLGRLNDLEIMQYTGLKDKNGKEIYEGDIVSYELTHDSSEKEMKSQVEWYRHAWRLNRLWLLTEISIIGVIGNIYENPELINVPAKM